MDAVAARSDPLRPETNAPSWRKRAGAPPKRPTPAILAAPDPPPDNSTPTGCWAHSAACGKARCFDLCWVQESYREATMQDLDEFTVTDAALAQMAATENPRLKEI